MDVRIVSSEEEGGKIALEMFKDQLAKNPASVFGLATGSSPEGFYREAVASDIDFTKATSINLDEYVGLDENNDQSYRYFMKDRLFDKKPFKKNYLPNGMADDLEAEVKNYDEIIRENPIDLQILGIGRNGHIGFNEPGTPTDITTHVVDLTPSTIEANARFFANEDEVPRQAISMGLGSIQKSKKIILFAYGEEKAKAIQGCIEGPVTTHVPASILQNLSDVTVIADNAATSLLKNK
ncbi:glucosamine-6-phosphate deaminase [Xylocopilactobacillus apicola]|uniref:Glucosamine-6-phosphate deaminase n=1 Tax=Xylocopilactobacillus apicola TaxID=2932184 RepID=A0AAU9DBM4_9LACO|nr:glucosamine-6-phosphate deaminase [Xylocopilactobacillus apicola]BDR58930.1 glucosamine-6-phosphate deaminase [Xylocopilactobacillus apicola]